MKKIFALLVVVVMLFGFSALAETSIADVSDSLNNLTVDSFRAVLDADLKLSMSAEGMDFSIPVKANVDLSFVDMLIAGKMNIEVPMLMEEPIASDFYMSIGEKSIDVFAQDEEGNWQTTSTDLESEFNMDAFALNASFGENATIEETADRIIIRDSIGDLLKTNGLGEEDMNELKNYAGEYADLAGEILKFMEDTDVIFEFTKDYTPSRIALENIEFKANIEGTDMVLTGSISVDYSDVNAVEAFEIPAEVIENATVFSVDE